MQTQSEEFLRVIESRYWRQEDAEVILAAWRASGGSVREFAERWEVNPGRITRWKKRLESEPDEALDFLPVRVVDRTERTVVDEPGAAGPRWVAELARQQWRVRVPVGFEGGELARLLGVVEEVERC